MVPVKRSSIGEIFGYQFATFLNLPLQPWAGFYDDSPDSERSPDERFGILVERWDGATGEAPLTCLADRAPDLVARGLALEVFERYEWGAWLLNGPEMRLIDVERVRGLFRRLARLNPKPFESVIPSARGGTLKHLSETQKDRLVTGLQRIWRAALQDWSRRCGGGSSSRPPVIGA